MSTDIAETYNKGAELISQGKELISQGKLYKGLAFERALEEEHIIMVMAWFDESRSSIKSCLNHVAKQRVNKITKMKKETK